MAALKTMIVLNILLLLYYYRTVRNDGFWEIKANLNSIFCLFQNMVKYVNISPCTGVQI